MVGRDYCGRGADLYFFRLHFRISMPIATLATDTQNYGFMMAGFDDTQRIRNAAIRMRRAVHFLTP